MRILLGLVIGFVMGAWLPFSGSLGLCLLTGTSPVWAVYMGYFFTLPTAVTFSILGGLWGLWHRLTQGAPGWEKAYSEDAPPVEPIILEPPPRSRRGPSRRGRS